MVLSRPRLPVVKGTTGLGHLISPGANRCAPLLSTGTRLGEHAEKRGVVCCRFVYWHTGKEGAAQK